MKNCLIFSVFLFSTFSFSQSKKEQIDILTNRVDSLNRVVGEERISNQNKINELNSTVTKLEGQITTLSGNLTMLNKELQESKDVILKKQKEIVENQRLISKLQSELKIKSDSLEIVKKEQSSQSYQVTQTGSFKSVKIGAQTWMAENLNVSTFRNGDPIPEVKTNEEWEKAGKEGKPAWCYYDNDPVNSSKYGKLYNWFAVNDPRGLAPEGWHIPRVDEWNTLKNYLSVNHEKKNSERLFFYSHGVNRSSWGPFNISKERSRWWYGEGEYRCEEIAFDGYIELQTQILKGEGLSVCCIKN